MVTRIAVGQLVKRLRMVGMDQVCELVDQDGVEHPFGDRSEAVRESDLPGVERARPPTGPLVGHPSHRGRAGSDAVSITQHHGPVHEFGISDGGAQRVFGHQSIDQPGDGLLAGFGGEVGGQRHHDATSHPAGLRSLASPGADPDLHLGPARPSRTRLFSGARCVDRGLDGHRAAGRPTVIVLEECGFDCVKEGHPAIVARGCVKPRHSPWGGRPRGSHHEGEDGGGAIVRGAALCTMQVTPCGRTAPAVSRWPSRGGRAAADEAAADPQGAPDDLHDNPAPHRPA